MKSLFISDYGTQHFNINENTIELLENGTF